MAQTHRRSSWLLLTVLSTTAGAVDVIGFLALGGLFTAHITGNVVIVAAHYATGGFSQIGPLLAVPPDGRTLTMQVTETSPRLSQTITYKQVYRRVS